MNSPSKWAHATVAGVALSLTIATSSVQAQLSHYRFSGIVDTAYQPENLDTTAQLTQGLNFSLGDRVEGSLIVDPTEGHPISAPHLPEKNLIYFSAVSDLSLQINEQPILSPNGQTLEMAVFDDALQQNNESNSPVPLKDGDTILMTTLSAIPLAPESKLGAAAADFEFTLMLNDSSGAAVKHLELSSPLQLQAFDNAKGFIRPWQDTGNSTLEGVTFQIDSLELVETFDRPVIAQGPKSQTVRAGDRIQLLMQEHRGNRGTRSKWTHNGFDIPTEAAETLTLDNLQPHDSGTYQVTVWNNLGVTNVATARIQVEGKHHRFLPLEASGWNADLIVGNGEISETHPAFDRGARKWYVKGYSGAVDGFPETGSFTSAANADILYQLQPYNQENVLWLNDETNPVARLELGQPSRYESLAIASASDAPTSEGAVRLVFEDGSMSDWHTLQSMDWRTSPHHIDSAAIAGLGTVVDESNSQVYRDEAPHGFGLYESEIRLSTIGLADRPISALEFTNSDSVASIGIFAVSGQQAQIQRGTHLTWPSESPTEVFEVATNPNGPWYSISDDITTIAGQTFAVMDAIRTPRYYRSRVKDLEGRTLALYTFDQNSRNLLSNTPGLTTPFPHYHQGSLVLDGRGIGHDQDRFRHFLEVPDIHYNNFSLAFIFRPKMLSESDSEILLAGGRRYQWLRVGRDEGRLSVILGQNEFTHVFEQIHIEPGQWHQLLIGVNTRERVLSIRLNGENQETITLPEGFHYELPPTSASDAEKALTFFDTSQATAFQGVVDLLMVTRRMLTKEETLQVDRLLEPNPVGNTVQWGHHLVWESNLNRFNLEQSESATGPWMRWNGVPELVNGRNVVLVDPQSPTSIYRLNTAR